MSKLIHVSGIELLTSITGQSADVLHPSANGMEEMARNLVGIIKSNMEI